MYLKNEGDTLTVSKVSQRVDGHGNPKSFKRQDGSYRWVFDVEFSNGYKAEFTSGFANQKEFVVGNIASFRVVDINNYGPTIELVSSTNNINVNGISIGSNNMNGNAAVYALGFAKDLAPLYNWNIMQVLDNADILQKWLIKNK